MRKPQTFETFFMRFINQTSCPHFPCWFGSQGTVICSDPSKKRNHTGSQPKREIWVLSNKDVENTQ